MRELAGRPGSALVFESIDLHHGPVSREGQVASEEVELLDGLPGRIDALLDGDIVTDGEAPGGEFLFKFLERCEGVGGLAGSESVADDA